MSKKIELRVHGYGDKSQPTIMKTVAKVPGIKSISMDSEKGVLTIIGTADVVEVVKQLKKAKKPAEIISVGPEKPPEKKDDKKDGDKKNGDNKNGDKKDGDKKDGDKKNGDKKNGDKKDGDKKDGDKKKPPLPCYCYCPQQCYCGGGQASNFPPPGYPPVVLYDQSPYSNCTIL
ncbi:Heavy metal transport/detoxification superfamily protein [Rhynchospora pubera]|uniref:Heavy metal transport/detoxification superfamily protein n=1 Tax=Rhynchospora pubera TaxID=906938 RepID=A0AAV8ATH4_9POAL|nr:Heavy metal transport/detoxification superfamily protein [Rhynchospora pubera]KAJ4763108.1 Heavy metal transport/detoxification superfamily protein [Rhynchospora pubera]